MNLPFFIARKYFFSTKKKSFINFISIISVLAVAAGTLAFIIILSIFNGFSDYIRKFGSALDGEIKVTAINAKTFEIDSLKYEEINKIEGVEAVTEVLQDYAFAVHYLKNGRKKYKIVQLKGVSPNVMKQYRLDTMVVYGEATLDKNGHPAAIFGEVVRSDLFLPVVERNGKYDMLPQQVEFIYPFRKSKKLKKVNSEYVVTGGAFFLEKYDQNMVFVPIETTRKLFDYKKAITALEVKSKSKDQIATVQLQLKNILGEGYKIENRDEQNSIILKAIHLEKIIVFFILSVVLMAAFINIFFTLSMLELEKRNDLKILFSIGAKAKTLKKIFLNLSLLISFVGAGIGTTLGLLIYWAQKTFSIIQVGPGRPYPMELNPLDIVLTFVVIVILSYLSGIRPAVKASKNNA